MKLKFAALLVGLLLAFTGSAQAQNLAYGAGLKERYDIPAPIPEHGAMAIPAGVPVPEGFTYYLRADLGWGFAGNRDYSENGRVYGADSAPFISSTGPFTSSDIAGLGSFDNDGVFIGTVGMGAYFTPRLRGDITLDFRGKQDLTATGAYTYASTTAGTTVDGLVTDHISLRSAAMLANVYFDLLPRGSFTPYVGAGVGFIYNDAKRTYTDTATPSVGGVPGTDQVVTGNSHDANVALAGALMAGVSFATSQAWTIDIGYRAMYMGGIDLKAPISGTGTALPDSKATIGNQWEQQVRIGLRYNIW